MFYVFVVVVVFSVLLPNVWWNRGIITATYFSLSRRVDLWQVYVHTFSYVKNPVMRSPATFRNPNLHNPGPGCSIAG